MGRVTDVVGLVGVLVLFMFSTALTAGVILALANAPSANAVPVPHQVLHDFLGSQPFNLLFVALVGVEIFLAFELVVVLCAFVAPTKTDEIRDVVRKPISEVEVKKCRPPTRPVGATSIRQ